MCDQLISFVFCVQRSAFRVPCYVFRVMCSVLCVMCSVFRVMCNALCVMCNALCVSFSRLDHFYLYSWSLFLVFILGFWFLVLTSNYPLTTTHSLLTSILQHKNTGNKVGHTSQQHSGGDFKTFRFIKYKNDDQIRHD